MEAVERASARLKTWRTLRELRCCPWCHQLAKAIHVLQVREAKNRMKMLV